MSNFNNINTHTTFENSFSSKVLESFHNYTHLKPQMRLFSAILIGVGSWKSKKLELIWKVRDTNYNGFYYQLSPISPILNSKERILLPTVVAHQGHRKLTNGENRSIKTGKKFGISLAQLAKSGMLPTPTANDMKNVTLPPSQINGVDSIVKRILQTESVTPDSQLNPRFVAEMMGFPANWTELPFLIIKNDVL